MSEITRRALLIMMMGLHTGASLAGTATIMNGKDATAIEYADEMLRLDTDDDGYMIVRDNRMYVVTGSTVMDATAMMGMFGVAMPAPAPSATHLNSLRNTGRTETIAEIRGEVWELSYVDEDGRNKTNEVVLSPDRRARELQRALALMTRALLQAAGEESHSADLLFNEFAKRKRGVLRMGDEFQASALSAKRVAAERFDLPSQPVAMPTFGAHGGAAKSGGLSSLRGLFGEQAERQQERVEGRTEEEVDQAADNAVNKVLDKAFGKLFGN